MSLSEEDVPQQGWDGENKKTLIIKYGWNEDITQCSPQEKPSPSAAATWCIFICEINNSGIEWTCTEVLSDCITAVPFLIFVTAQSKKQSLSCKELLWILRPQGIRLGQVIIRMHPRVELKLTQWAESNTMHWDKKKQN